MRHSAKGGAVDDAKDLCRAGDPIALTGREDFHEGAGSGSPIVKYRILCSQDPIAPAGVHDLQVISPIGMSTS